MRARWPLCLLVALLCGCAQAQKKFTLEELTPYQPQFYPTYFTGQWISDDEFAITQGAGSDYVLWNVTSNVRSTLISSGNLTNLRQTYNTDNLLYKDGDSNRLIIYNDYEAIFPSSYHAKFAVYDISTGSIWSLGGGQKLQAYRLDTTERPAAAYVYENNVYYVADYTASGEGVQLTTDGVPDVVFNGVPDYVYDADILNSNAAMWFSKNGSYLAVLKIDDTNVNSYSYEIYGDPFNISSQYPTIKSLKYPKPGNNNPVVTLRVYPVVDSSSSSAVELPAPTDVVGSENILGSVVWIDDTRVALTWLNRRQNVSVLSVCDVTTVSCSNKVVRSQANGWIDLNTPRFDNTGDIMIAIAPGAEGDDFFKHIILYNLADNTTKDLTPGSDTVLSIQAWNKETGTIYYLVAPRDAPWNIVLYSTTITDATPVCLTCDRADCPVVDTYFSNSAAYSHTFCSATNQPYISYTYTLQNNTFTELANNSVLVELLSQYALPTAQFEVAELDNGARAHIKLVLPPDFDSSQSYPLILTFNAGPTVTTVSNRYVVDYSTYLASNRSFIVGFVDTRGSPNMGYNDIFAVNEKLGQVDLQDALAAIRYLTDKYSYVDASRVGAWGYDAPSVDLYPLDTDNLLSCAAVITPVVSYVYLSSMYSEKFMGLLDDNIDGYEAADILLKAESFRDRNILLLHGTADYSYHVTTTLLLSKVLQEANIDFEQKIYTDGERGLFSVYRDVFVTIDNFWTKCFEG